MKSILERYEGSKIIRVNTDEIIYIVPKHYGHTVETQVGYGGLRNEVLADTAIEAVHSLGSKTCNVITKNTETGLVSQNPKVCGLNLQQEITSGKIDSSSFANILQTHCEKLTVVHSKSRKKTPNESLEPAQNELTKHTISAKHVDLKRHCDAKTLYYETHPYGKKL